MAKQKTGGQKKGTPNKITTDVRAEGTTRAAPAAAPSAGGLGPQYFGLRTMVLQDRRTPVQVPKCMARPCVARRNVERANVRAASMYQTSGVEH